MEYLLLVFLWPLLLLSVPISASPYLQKRLTVVESSCAGTRFAQVKDANSIAQEIGKIAESYMNKFIGHLEGKGGLSQLEVETIEQGLKELYKITNYQSPQTKEIVKRIKTTCGQIAKIQPADIRIFCDRRGWLAKVDDKGQSYKGDALEAGKQMWWDSIFHTWTPMKNAFCAGVHAFNTHTANTRSPDEPRDIITFCPDMWRVTKGQSTPREIALNAPGSVEYKLSTLKDSVAGALFHEFTHTEQGGKTIDVKWTDPQGKKWYAVKYDILKKLNTHQALENAETYATMAMGLYLLHHGFKVSWSEDRVWRAAGC